MLFVFFVDPVKAGDVVSRNRNSHLVVTVTFSAFALPGLRTRQPGGLFRWVKRSSMFLLGLFVVLLGILIAPLPGPGGVPVIALGLILILRSSYRAKRYFIRAQYARPRWVYPFRRLLRRNPEFAPVFWQQALRAEKMVEKVVLRRRHRRLIRLRKMMRRMWRRAFG